MLKRTKAGLWTLTALGLGLSLLSACGTDPVVDTSTTDPSGTSTDTTDSTEPTLTLPFGYKEVTTTTCTNQGLWDRGDHGSRSMHPGRDCIDCHADQHDAPDFLVAGTIMPTIDEANDCLGVADIDVIVVDANGTEFKTTSNVAGNFYFKTANFSSAVTPITARLEIDNVVQAEMEDPQDTTNCNACHTASGANEAKGRITVEPR